MYFSRIFAVTGFLACSFANAVQAVSNPNFAGSNLYYAAGLISAQQATLFSNLKDAGVKVLRVWLDGQPGSPKNTPINAFPGLEGTSGPGNYDDTVLERLDDVMVTAHGYGIKLHISIHSFNALKGNADFYGNWYGTGYFYTDANAQAYFKNRIAHVLAHVNKKTGKRWADSPDYIFAFEAQNEASNSDEAFLRAHMPAWQCAMAQAIKDNLGAGKSDILVATGGGGWVDVSVLDGYMSCAAIDVIGIHAYGNSDLTAAKLQPKVAQAKQAGKKLVMQEWGVCYYATQKNQECNGGTAAGDAARGQNIQTWAAQINQAGIPAWYWMVIPNNDPHGSEDFEVGVTESIWDTLKSTMQSAKTYEGAFDFSRWLL